jgi:hypothetical protein
VNSFIDKNCQPTGGLAFGKCRTGAEAPVKQWEK